MVFRVRNEPDARSINTESLPPPYSEMTLPTEQQSSASSAETQHLYYLLRGSDGLQLDSRRVFNPDLPFFGRIALREIPPPRTIAVLKRCVNSIEGFSNALIYSDEYTREPMPDVGRLNEGFGLLERPFVLAPVMDPEQEDASEYFFYRLYTSIGEATSAHAFRPNELSLGRVSREQLRAAQVDALFFSRSAASVLSTIAQIEPNTLGLASADLYTALSASEPLDKNAVLADGAGRSEEAAIVLVSNSPSDLDSQLERPETARASMAISTERRRVENSQSWNPLRTLIQGNGFPSLRSPHSPTLAPPSTQHQSMSGANIGAQYEDYSHDDRDGPGNQSQRHGTVTGADTTKQKRPDPTLGSDSSISGHNSMQLNAPRSRPMYQHGRRHLKLLEDEHALKLIDLIISFVDSDPSSDGPSRRSTLMNCSLAASAFREPCQKRIFRSIFLDSGRTSLSGQGEYHPPGSERWLRFDEAAECFNTFPHLARYHTNMELVIRIPGLSIRHLAHSPTHQEVHSVMTHLRHVRAVVVRGFDEDAQHRTRDGSLRWANVPIGIAIPLLDFLSSGNLRTLSFGQFADLPQSVIQVIFTACASLTIHDFTMVGAPGAVVRAQPLSSPLHTHAIRELFLTVYVDPYPIHSPPVGLQVLQHSLHVLAILAPRLEHLSLSMSNLQITPDLHIPDIHLPYLPALQVLKIAPPSVVYGYPKAYTYVERLLQRVLADNSLPALKELILWSITYTSHCPDIYYSHIPESLSILDNVLVAFLTRYGHRLSVQWIVWFALSRHGDPEDTIGLFEIFSGDLRKVLPRSTGMGMQIVHQSWKTTPYPEGTTTFR